MCFGTIPTEACMMMTSYPFTGCDKLANGLPSTSDLDLMGMVTGVRDVSRSIAPLRSVTESGQCQATAGVPMRPLPEKRFGSGSRRISTGAMLLRHSNFTILSYVQPSYTLPTLPGVLLCVI